MSDLYALTFVEIDIPICIETYSVDPCEAALGVTGDIKCFNCRSTCQDPDHFNEEEVTLRFAMPSDYLVESGIDAIAIMTGLNFSPAEISLGEDLGQRASLTVNFEDIPWSDTGPGFDPYVAERPYNPFEQGSFWGKFRSRQPYLRGRAFRVIRGFLGQTLAEMETRHYIVDSFTGPTSDGAFSITAKDILKQLDGDRALCPKPSNGFLPAEVTSGATSFNLTPSGIGNAEYPATGLVAIGGKEIVRFSRSGDAMTIVANAPHDNGRGLLGTSAQVHKAQDRVQVVKVIEGQGPADIIYDYEVNYADIPPEWIDLTAWQSVVSAFNGRLYTTYIAQPTSVKKLVSEMIQQAGLVTWTDEIGKKIRLDVLRQIPVDAETFTEDNVSGDVTITEQHERRLSRVHTYYGMINPLDGDDDPSNFRQMASKIDEAAEIEYGSPAVLEIFSRYIPDGGRSAADRINDILIGRFRDPPRRLSFPVFRGGPDTPTLGEGCQIGAWPLQDPTGLPVLVPGQIVRLNPLDGETRVEADELRFSADMDDPSVRDLFFESNINGINARAKHDLQYPAPVGGETVNVYIEEGAVIGATGYGLPAVDVGTWPSITFTGGRTSASAVVTVTDTSAFKVGMAVSGPGFTGYRRILSIVTNTSITLDGNSSAGGSTTLTLWTTIVNLFVRGRLQGAGGPGGQGAYFVQGPNIRTTAGDGAPGSLALYARYPINLFLDTGLARIWGGAGGGGGAGVLALSNQAGGSGGGGAGVPGGSGAPGTNSGTSNSEGGGNGTLNAGGPGGRSFASFSPWIGPNWTDAGGGAGGVPGQYGGSGASHNGNGAEQQVGAGGAPGPAIDGTSFVKKTGTGDLLGGEIN